jgi:hypothetical protein
MYFYNDADILFDERIKDCNFWGENFRVSVCSSVANGNLQYPGKVAWV